MAPRISMAPIPPSPDSYAEERPLREGRKSMFIPPGFAHKLETLHDRATGVTFQAGYDSFEGAIPPQVLKYDARVVLSTRGAWNALLTQTRDATAVFGAHLGRKVLSFGAVALGCMLLGPTIEADVDESVASLSNVIAAGLFFLLGPYVGTSVSRWWQIRKDCVGGLWGAIDDLSAYAAAWFSRRSAPDRAARALVLRLGLCSHALLYKQARGEDGDLEDLQDLVMGGLLLEHEAVALADLPSKSQVVWAWMTLFWTRALEGSLDCSAVPHAAAVSPMIFSKCMAGRGAIGMALAFIDTQQPFPYVHLLAVITDVALLVNAVSVGLHTGRQLASTSHCAGQPSPCAAALFVESRLNVCVLVLLAAVRVAAFTLIYNGLLAIGISLDNPIGDDPADLPGLAYQVFMRNECEGFYAGVDEVDTARGWWEGLDADAGDGDGDGARAPAGVGGSRMAVRRSPELSASPAVGAAGGLGVPQTPGTCMKAAKAH